MVVRLTLIRKVLYSMYTAIRDAMACVHTRIGTSLALTLTHPAQNYTTEGPKVAGVWRGRECHLQLKLGPSELT